MSIKKKKKMYFCDLYRACIVFVISQITNDKNINEKKQILIYNHFGI